MAFSDKISYDRIFQQVTHKRGESEMNYIKRFQNAQDLSVSVGKFILRISSCTFYWITFINVENIQLK